MTKSRRFILRLPRARPRIGVFFVVVAALSVAAVSVLPPRAIASPANAARRSPGFAGYVATPSSSLFETASVVVTVPTIKCTNNVQVLYVMEEVQAAAEPGGDMVAYVGLECSMNGPREPGYFAWEGGSQGCVTAPQQVTVSPGDSVRLSVSTTTYQQAYQMATVEDETTGDGSTCDVQDEPGIANGPAYTGVCNQPLPNDTSLISGDSLHTDGVGKPSACDFGSGSVLKFTPINFAVAMVGSASLGSWNPLRLDMFDGSTLEVSARKLSDNGESFEGVFKDH